MTAVVGLDLRTQVRFWSKVDRRRSHECWPWLRYRDRNGYGRFSLGGRAGRMYEAHRVAWLLAHGSLPSLPLEIDHLCRRRWCVNPTHMEPVSHRENSRRSTAGATNAARQRAVTECPSGHRYDDVNTGVRADGRRRCRACGRDRARTYRRDASRGAA